MILRNCLIALSLAVLTVSAANAQQLKRGTVVKPTYTVIGDHLNSDMIVLKIKEDAEAPVLSGNRFLNSSTPEWSKINSLLEKASASKTVAPFFKQDKRTLESLRSMASAKAATELADLTRYYDIEVDASLANSEKVAMINELNALDIVEIAYFPAIPKLPVEKMTSTTAKASSAPNWQNSQFYLSPAPAGVDAYYAWENPGGKGQNIKVIDIEGNWVEHHEDLRGGATSFHIAGAKINDPTWYMHGTAVLGEIASDSNGSGMTGIAYQVNLGTVSVGSMSIGNAINTAVSNCIAGDVILLELQIGGPNGGNYVPVEYEQATFDAILQGSALGRIIVEAGANGGQNLDDAGWYGNLFNPSFRFSGAIMVGAANPSHFPEGFSSYGQRVDVHAYGEQVYTLAYGDLFGSDTTNYYTAGFSGTSSASPIIVGACAVLQGIHKATYGTVIDHTEMRSLLRTYSTPQVPSARNIGPMPNLRGSVDEVIGVSFSADTVFGIAPFPVNFSAASGLAVDSWAWSFGDGDSAFVQNPSHVYTDAGIFDVGIEVTAGANVKEKNRAQYIAVVADSIKGSSVSGAPDSLVEVVISGNNTVPLTSFKIAVDLAGDLGASLESFSTNGCRTSFMGMPTISHFVAPNSQFTLRVNSASTPLAPGNGPLMKLYFRIPGSAEAGQVTHINLSGYSGHDCEYSGIYPDFEPVAGLSTISVCGQRGDVNGSGSITIQDLVYLVSYLYNNGPSPSPVSVADVNCTNSVTVADLVRLVSFLFAGGPAPCGC